MENNFSVKDLFGDYCTEHSIGSIDYDGIPIKKIIHFVAIQCKKIDAIELDETKVSIYNELLDNLQKVGQLLDNLGSFQLMLHVAHQAAHIYPYSPSGLNFHWHGIGNWQQ